MDDFLTEDTKATFLLCGDFGKNISQGEQLAKPLSHGEYNTLVQWLIQEKLRPKDMLNSNVLVKACASTDIQEERLEKLLGRGVHLGFTIEQWQRYGIWLISRSDADYPIRLKEHLHNKAPVLLFGTGDRSLLSGGGVGVVGSRNINYEGSQFAEHVARLCVKNNIDIVSGGAKGVDLIAMNAALESGGRVTGILADNLLHRSLETPMRLAIAENRLLLLSTQHPEFQFTAWAAMTRNKLIYAMSDFGLIVSADYQKGGTWNGAQEELKRTNSIPIFVYAQENMPQGNEKLLELGALPWPKINESENFINQLQTTIKQNKIAEPSPLPLLDIKQEKPVCTSLSDGLKPKISDVVADDIKPKENDDATKIYNAFMDILLAHMPDAMTVEEISERFSINKTQANAWLKKAVSDKKIRKLSKPVRYEKREKLADRNSLV